MRWHGLLLLAGAFMIPHGFRLAFCGAALQAGCAGTPLTAVEPTLVLEDYVEGAPRSSYLVPFGSDPVERMVRQLDGPFHSVFVNCQTRLAYIAKRSGVIDSIYWFGPFDL